MRTVSEAPVRLGGPVVASPVNPLCDGSRAHRVIWFCGSTAGDRRANVSRGTGDGSQGAIWGPPYPGPRLFCAGTRPGRWSVLSQSARAVSRGTTACVSRGTEPTPSAHYPAAVPSRRTRGSIEWPASQRSAAIHAYSTLPVGSFTPTKPEFSIITVTKLPGVVGWVKLQPKFLRKRPKWAACGLHIRDGSDRGVREGVVLVSDEPTTIFLSQPQCEAEPVLRIVGELRFHSTAEERMGERNILAGRHIQ